MKTDPDPPANIGEYISGFPDGTRKALEQVRAAVRKSAPAAVETIKYGIPTYVLNGKNLVHFGGFRNHIGFYPTPTGIEAFREELAAYESAKGSVRFPFDKPMPLALIGKILKFRVKEVKLKPARGKKQPRERHSVQEGGVA